MERPDHEPLRSDYLDASLREAASSQTFETVLNLSTPLVFNALWKTYFSARLAKLANHPVANFLVARSITRLDTKQLLAVAAELKEANTGKSLIGMWPASVLLASLTLSIENSRSGPLKALLERATVLEAAEAEVVDVGHISLLVALYSRFLSYCCQL